MEFPEKLYVKQEDVGDESPCLIAETELESTGEIGNDVEVGVYELVGVHKVTTSVQIK